jgi:uncharacterized protein (DUF2336 family)
MGTHVSLINELETAIQAGSDDKRVATLRRITDLFLANANGLSNRQIEVFDEVLGYLIKRIESKALAELSARLAPVETAPTRIVRRLATDEDIAIAGPVLAQSARLTTHDLVTMAETRGQAHLLAISGRARLEKHVTDALLQRNDRDVDRSLASNSGALFSETGLSTLVGRAEDDENLAVKIGSRRDIPLDLVRQLVLRATEAVRSRLLALMDEESGAEIRRVLSRVSDEVGREVRDYDGYAVARRLVRLMQENGELDEATLIGFAKTKRYQEMVCALSLLCSTPVEVIDRLLHGDQREVFIIPCKAAGFEWSTVSAILNARSAGCAISDHDLARAKSEYGKLTKSTAERVLRFWQVREAVSENLKPRNARYRQYLDELRQQEARTGR